MCVCVCKLKNAKKFCPYIYLLIYGNPLIFKVSAFSENQEKFPNIHYINTFLNRTLLTIIEHKECSHFFLSF